MPTNLHLLYGADDFLVEQKARALIDASVPPADRTLGLETIDGRVDKVDEAVATVRKCLEAVQTPGFFGGTKLVWLKNATFLSPLARPGDSETVKERVAELTACIKGGLPEGQRLLITAISVSRNSAFFKACQAAGEVSDFGGGEKSWEQENRVKETLDGLLPKFGLRMADDVRERFLQRTGTTTRLVVNELEKLSLYLRGGKAAGEVTTADVDAIVALGREAEVWDLTDAVGERNAAKMMKALRQLQSQDENAIRLVGMVEGRVRDLIVLRQAMDAKWFQNGRWCAPLPPDVEGLLTSLPKDPRSLAPFIQRKNAAQAVNYTLNELRRARHVLIELREKLVSSSTPPEILVELALLRLIARRAPAPGAGSRRPAAPAATGGGHR